MAIETITAPTLAVSYEDDGFGTALAARYVGGKVPGARTHIFPDGGHIGIGHDAESFAVIDTFLKEIGLQRVTSATSALSSGGARRRCGWPRQEPIR
jgi:pimeloyl-ACP methyl ester carboxylesterase